MIYYCLRKQERIRRAKVRLLATDGTKVLKENRAPAFEMKGLLSVCISKRLLFTKVTFDLFIMPHPIYVHEKRMINRVNTTYMNLILLANYWPL